MLQVEVFNESEQRAFEHKGGPLEFGRGPGDPRRAPRCIISNDPFISRDHVRIEEGIDGWLKIENLSERNPVWFGETSTIGPLQKHELPLPVRLTVGQTVISLEADVPISREELKTITKPFRPGSSVDVLKSVVLHQGETPSAEILTQWFEAIISVQRAAAGSPEFYRQTAQALIDLVGLDRGLVILLHGETWEVMARAPMNTEGAREFSRTILQHVVRDRRTYFRSDLSGSISKSIAGAEAVVASPIFDSRDQVAGAVYGARRWLADRRVGIGSLEAMVVQLLASAVGAGLARLEQELKASELRGKLRQFFTPELAVEVEQNPHLLDGQEREITILFSDIRGFSRLSQRIEAPEICRLIQDVMDMITLQVLECEGVVVDYAGDGLMAMWNAPKDHPGHALAACRAALAIQQHVPALSERWKDRIGGPLTIGLGLNTGRALVGNTGSSLKFKYGPLGHPVNLASRVEGATKHLGIPALITASTQALIGDQFATRRLCKARLAGMDNPIELYELNASEPTPEWHIFRQAYELALQRFESAEWHECCRALYPLLDGQVGKYDIPCLNLVVRAVECLRSPPKDFDPVLDINVK